MPSEHRATRVAAVAARHLAIVLALSSCSEPAPSEGAGPRPRTAGTRGPPPVVTARRIATDGSFDLVATPDGAVLAWGPPQSEGGGVRVMGLTPLGGLAVGERDIATGALAAPRAQSDGPTQVLEVVALSSGSTLGVAWVAPNVSTHSAEANVSTGGIEGFGPAFWLADAAAILVSSSPRGRLVALSGDDGALRVRLRTPSSPCASDSGCEGRASGFRLDDPRRRRAVEGRGETVPSACDPFLVGAVTADGTSFHALCHLGAGGAASTVLYAIDPEPMHAAAPILLTGCSPLAVAPTRAGAALVAQCPEGVSVAWIDGTGRIEGIARPGHREAACLDGRATLRVVGDGATLEVPLTAAVSRVEGLLPESIAGPRARAAWTGTALLVAEPARGEVSIERWQCPSFPSSLRRSDEP